MSALTKAVKFRSLVDQLDDAEFNRMITRLLRSCSRADVLTWLFKQFCRTDDESFGQQLLNNAIRDSSHLIQSRDNDQNEEESENKTIVESLSGDLYREIASYLMHKEYFTFSQTNRAIFVGCNCPNSLHYLNLTNVGNYSEIDLRKYPQLRRLKIDLTRFNQLKLPRDGSTVCHNLTHLALDGNEKTNIDIAAFVNDKCFNFERLQQLQLQYFGKVNHNTFSVDKFRRLLSKFQMISSLSLHGFYCLTARINDETMQSLLPNLRRITINGTKRPTATQFIRLCGDKLTSLKFIDYARTLPDVSFSKLSHLFVSNNSNALSNFDTFLKSAKMLKKVVIHDIYNVPKDWEKRVNDILSEQNCLEYFGIQANTRDLVHITNGFESGLYDSDHIKNDITIHLYFASGSLDSKKAFIYLSRIVQALAASKRKNFMLLCDFPVDMIKNDEKLGMKVTNFLNKHKARHQTHVARDKIGIWNKDCKINGFDSHSMFWMRQIDL